MDDVAHQFEGYLDRLNRHEGRLGFHIRKLNEGEEEPEGTNHQERAGFHIDQATSAVRMLQGVVNTSFVPDDMHLRLLRAHSHQFERMAGQADAYNVVLTDLARDLMTLAGDLEKRTQSQRA